MDIKRTIWGAFGYVYKYRKAFAKALLVPISLLVVLGAVPIQDFGGTSIVVLTFVSFFIYAVLAITTHRIILLGPESISEWGVYIPRKREFYFILYSIGLGLLLMPLGLFTLIPTIGQVIMVLAAIYTMARLSLVFPGIATDQRWTFSDSWQATRGHQILMVVVVAVFPFVISVPEQLLSHVPYAGVFVNLLSAFTTVFVVAALSVAFQVITESAGKG